MAQTICAATRVRVTRIAVASALFSVTLPVGASAEVGGRRAVLPQAARIMSADGTRSCSGVLVGSRAVLTDAHCMSGTGGVYVRLSNMAGQPIPPVVPGSGAWTRADHARVDPAYDAVTCASTPYECPGDVAVVRLDHPARIAPLKIADPTAGGAAVSYGFGSKRWPDGPMARNLWSMAVTLTTIPTPLSLDQFAAVSPPAQSPGVGDSGGPLIQHERVVGLNEMSGGPGVPSIYDAFDAWTRATVTADS